MPVGRQMLAAASLQPALFALLLCIPGTLFAHTDDKPADEWIRSPEPLKQAWAAHWIAEQKLTLLTPELLRIIESPESSADVVTDTAAAKFAALDALIQLGVEVPVAELEPLVRPPRVIALKPSLLRT